MVGALVATCLAATPISTLAQTTLPEATGPLQTSEPDPQGESAGQQHVVRPAQPQAIVPAGEAAALGRASAAPPRFGSSQSPLHAIRAGEASDTVRPSGKILRYAARMIRLFDRNGDGRLDESEWSQMRGTPRLNDLDQDGWITEQELAERIAAYSQRRAVRLMPLSRHDLAATGAPDGVTTLAAGLTARPIVVDNAPSAESPAARPRGTKRFHVSLDQLPKGLGEWFVDHDADGDGQITMTEFSARLTEVEAAQFTRIDLNGDGVITPLEFLEADEARQAQEAAAESASQAAPADSAASDARPSRSGAAAPGPGPGGR